MDQLTSRWTMSDEEWGRLAFMIFELGNLQQQLEGLLLCDQRPTFNGIWKQVDTYRQSSDGLLDYMAACMRDRMGISDRLGA